MTDDKRRELLERLLHHQCLTPDDVAELISEAGALLVFLDDHADEATVIGALQMMYRKGRADQRAKDAAAVLALKASPINAAFNKALEAAAQEIENQTE